MNDLPVLEALIPRSAFELQKNLYSEQQIKAALGPVFGVDCQLIEDGTYYVVTEGDAIVGCGGWSFRASKFGGSEGRMEADPRLDPKHDPARIRAFFVDPKFARQGIGSALMNQCETAILAMGFERVEITATLAGERLYERFDYSVVDRDEIPLVGATSMATVRMFKMMDQKPGQD
ncbi:GNAT family N-acetyltransferase [Verrucomicrobia bacterium]|nr:GNAT family N-acetyltransferase [Verrucomicrobiota bacterium]